MPEDNQTVVAIQVIDPPLTVEMKVMKAAEDGNIEALYELIRDPRNEGFLKNFDEREFVDTPLHIAAAAGRTKFALELMCLKPSFLTKLNQDGLSPIHLGVQNEHTETVISLLKFDKNLPRLKGKNCYTPFHFLVMKGDLLIGVLKKFLKDCPECIHDVTNDDETALHLAARYNNFEALKVLLQWLPLSDLSWSEMKTFMNSKNREGDTVLHIAASNNQPKIIRLLIRQSDSPLHLLDPKATNSRNLTAMGILEGGNQEQNRVSLDILRNNTPSYWRIVTFNYCLIPLKIILRMVHEIRNISDDRINALLVATVLILTATYQAALSPPGGVFQPNPPSQENTTSTTTSLQIIHSSGAHNTSTTPWWRRQVKFHKNPFKTGSSVLNTTHFLSFFIPNIGAFFISFFVTCLVLIKILPVVLSFALVISLSMLLFCLLVSAVLIISPGSQSLNVMLKYTFVLIYVIYMLIIAVLFGKVVNIIRRRRFA